MASLAGLLHRPLSAAAAVAVATASSDLPERFSHNKLSEPNVSPQSTASDAPDYSVVRRASVAGLLSPFANASPVMQNSNLPHVPRSLYGFSSAPIASPLILAPYQYAKIVRPPPDHDEPASTIPSSSSDTLYRWHLPDPRASRNSGSDTCSSTKSRTVVVLLGWLGARQKHLKRYADWYTSRGYNVVTFTFPMSEVVSYKVGGKAEKDLELLADHLAGWVSEEIGKNLVFHTFSNTGWLTYGVILEKFRKQDLSLMEKIKGCIVDSAPVAAPDPQVWASGFSAAFLKKQSIATKGTAELKLSRMDVIPIADSGLEPKPAATEAALLAVLEKFFEVVLKLPAVNRRLSDILRLLSKEQPKCPQLYIYSSADRVIPAKSVESFVERQRRAGHEVRACDFVSSPHVDHFRNHPALYTSQLTTFLEECVLTCCKDSS
ncbi:transmembrane protein 53 [Ananas comosus]|uniref:Transmembrane protein 53 n=1 Tax=Ananas comosus TaxID=4615 RepID=A0A199W3G6_ANACO|nr:transmembrane protein 53 [Ananas comosus]OAY83781.1 Transmembrane protein 53 [Ananas comosus]